MQKILSFILVVLRFITGVIFILSGVFKLVDPVGAGLKIGEYLTAFHAGFLSSASDIIGILLAVLELVTGTALLTGVRIRFFSLVSVCLISFFTVVTFFLYMFSPIQDCGCFGEAIHLSNAQTFYKNLILLICIIPVVIYRRKFRTVTGRVYEWSFLAYHAVMAAALSLYWLNTGPLAEFGDFKVGTNLVGKMEMQGETPPSDIFVYEKNGEKREFLLSEIPDSTWHFVETLSVSGEPDLDAGHVFDFAVTDEGGTYITDSIIRHAGPVFLFPVHEPDELGKEQWRELSDMACCLREAGCVVEILLPGPSGGDTPLTSGSPVAYCDHRTLLSLSRSNAGAVYLNDGTVAGKYHRGGFSSDVLLQDLAEDAGELTARNSAAENIRLELLFLILLSNMIVFRYVCSLKRGCRK